MSEICIALDYAATTLFEIDLARLEGRVPAPLSPIEVRPGVGLVSLTVCCVVDGEMHGKHGALPAYGEAVFCIHVEPDVSVRIPDMAILVLCFAATHRAALVANADHHDLHVFEDLIKVEVDRPNHVMFVSDSTGPIAKLTCNHPNPVYASRPATLQVFTATDGGVRRYDEHFVLSSFRHQRRAPCAEIHDHPFFQGVQMRSIRRPFLQWVGDPSQPITQVATTPTRSVLEVP